jgi:O-antigen ligase
MSVVPGAAALEEVEDGPQVTAAAENTSELRVLWRERRVDQLAVMLAFCAVPISIAVAEALLSLALALHVLGIARGSASLRVPRAFRYWLVWAGLEIVVWILSPDRKAGLGEMRHLLLLAGLFVVAPILGDANGRLLAWRGIFLTATLSSLFLIGDFVSRLFYYSKELHAGGDVSLYLRSAGLLNNWMVYGTVEILVMAGLVSFWLTFPKERRRWWPVAVVNGVAIILSLTRMAWVACFLLLVLALLWRRSKWCWGALLLPLVLYMIMPGVIRSRVKESLRPNYYSNLERMEMLRVGWKMIKEHPLTGVGPGRAGRLYLSYLAPGDPIPAYHGHLHNNLVQLAAEFGLLVAAASVGFVLLLYRELWRALRSAKDISTRFGCETGILALTGFCVAGLFDYTYGHSLGLILVAFAVLSPLGIVTKARVEFERPPGS